MTPPVDLSDPGPPEVLSVRRRQIRAGGFAVLSVVGSVAAWVGAAAYSSFLLAGLAGSHVSASRSLVSELEAAGQPYAAAFRLSDVVSGIAIVLVALVLPGRVGWTGYGRTGYGRAGCACLGLLGLTSISDGLTRMPCAPSISAACRARLESGAGVIGEIADPHALSGAVGFAAAVLAMLFVGVALRPRWKRAGGWSIAVGLTVAGIGLVDLPLILLDSAVGVAERARVVLTSCWLVGLGVVLFSERGGRGRGRVRTGR